MPVLILHTKSTELDDAVRIIGVFDCSPAGKAKLNKAKEIYREIDPNAQLTCLHCYTNSFALLEGKRLA